MSKHHINTEHFFSLLIKTQFLILVSELNSIEFNFDPRYMIPQVRSNPTQSSSSSHYNPLPSNEQFVFLFS